MIKPHTFHESENRLEPANVFIKNTVTSLVCFFFCFFFLDRQDRSHEEDQSHRQS